jgi:hypothetical protein
MVMEKFDERETTATPAIAPSLVNAADGERKQTSHRSPVIPQPALGTNAVAVQLLQKPTPTI